jgi:two-component system, OmpR family, copper resistance phosphate regulon response regulator CusR
MLCDDDPEITHVLREGLSDAGFEVESFNDSRVALSQFWMGAYSAVILDEMMPNMDGIVLYKLIKQKDPHVKVFFLTSYERSVRRALPELEARLILEKPIAIATLVQRLREANESRGTKDPSSQ